MKVSTTNLLIAALDGRSVRKFVSLLKKLGASAIIDRPNHKCFNDSEGNRVFSALKYSNGWDCRYNEMFDSNLREIIKK